MYMDTEFHKGIRKGSRANLGFIYGLIGHIYLLIHVSLLLQHTIFFTCRSVGLTHAHTHGFTHGAIVLTCAHSFTCGSLGLTHVVHTCPLVNPWSPYTHTELYMWIHGVHAYTHVTPCGHPPGAHRLLRAFWLFVLLIPLSVCPSSTVTMPLRKGTRARHLLQMAPLLLPLRSE